MSTRIEVLSPGALSTVRDLGRPGLAHLGVSPGGAADTLALQIANHLVGNPGSTAGIEMTLQGGRFRFHSEPTTVALCGGAFDCNLPLWRSHLVEPGFELDIRGCSAGVRLYLAVRKGVTGQVTRGVRLLGGSGSFRDAQVPPYPYRKVLRITTGSDTGDFEAGSFDTLLAGDWTVADQSNRQGIRLIDGPALAAPGGGVRPSEGVALGAIQVPPSGQPMILFVDSQTTGGYPVLANIASVDLPSVAQLRPRDRVRFEYVPFTEARRLLIEQEAWIQNAVR